MPKPQRPNIGVATSLPRRLSLKYSVDLLDAKGSAQLHKELALWSDLEIEKVGHRFLEGTNLDPAFLLIDSAAALPLPATPFADIQWPAVAVRALSRHAVLVDHVRFTTSAKAGGLRRLHAELYASQYFHRAVAARLEARRRSRWQLSLSGLSADVAPSLRCDRLLHQQCTESSLRILPLRTDGRSRAHFKVLKGREGRRKGVPTVRLSDLEAIRDLDIMERRNRFSELVIEAFAAERPRGE